MSATTVEKPAASKKPPVPMNGVDTPKLFATIAAVADQRSLAQFRFRAEGKWISGTHMRSTTSGFYGAGGDMQRKAAHSADADHPEVLCGKDCGPTLVEFLLHALAACVTAGIANIAAARGITLHAVDCSIEGDIDLQGILGLSDNVRNGFKDIRARFRVKGNACEETLRKVVAQAIARSAVLDVLQNGVPVSIQTDF